MAKPNETEIQGDDKDKETALTPEQQAELTAAQAKEKEAAAAAAQEKDREAAEAAQQAVPAALSDQGLSAQPAPNTVYVGVPYAYTPVPVAQVTAKTGKNGTVTAHVGGAEEE